MCSIREKAEWERAHEALTVLAKDRAMHDFEEAKWILVAVRSRVDRKLGFGCFSEYLERLFGYSPRLAREKVRVAEALDSLPDIAQALADGVLHWSAVRELTRVADLQTETAWLEAARGRSMREIEAMVSGRLPGDLPTDPSKPHATRHTIHAVVSAETIALWRDALAAIQHDAGGTLSEDDAIKSMARTILEGPKDTGRANYQIVITRCEDCGRATQRGRGEEIPLAPEVAEAAECDAQTIDLRSSSSSSSSAAPRATQQIPPATRRLVMHRDHHRCAVPGCRNTIFIDVHHLHAKSEGGDHDPNNLITLCGAHHTQVHVGRLIIERTPDGKLIFKHADGTPYGNAAMAPGLNNREDRSYRGP